MRSLLVALVAVTLTAAANANSVIQPGTEAGRRIYSAQCAACHGVAGEGQPAWDRPGPGGDLPAPPHNRKGHTWKHSDAMLYRMVRDGWRDPFNKSRALTMPAFGAVLSPAETLQVVEYLKTLWTPAQRKSQREESRNAPYPSEALTPVPLPKQKH